jgi:hypothetical protein
MEIQAKRLKRVWSVCLFYLEDEEIGIAMNDPGMKDRVRTEHSGWEKDCTKQVCAD